MATPVGPRIAPVNYVVHEDAIVFRTAPYSELSTYGWNVDLAFEIDQLDPDDVQRIRRTGDPEPWAAGPRHLYVSLVWRQLTGVRLEHPARAR